MNFDLATLLRAAQAVGPVVAALPAVRRVFNEAVKALSTDDQAEAKEALDDLIADNDDGHARLQAKLDAASRR